MARLLAVNFVVVFLITSQHAQAAHLLNIAEGQDCPLPNGVVGQCSKIRNCPGELKALMDPSKPRKPLCSFQGNGRKAIPIVCCTYGRTGQRSIDECENVITAAQNNFDQFESISNGIAARNFSHMALLGFEGPQTDPDLCPIWRCGGTLISNQFVLTAAHCLEPPKQIQNNPEVLTTIRLGEYDLDVRSNNEQDVQVAADGIFRHPDYKAPAVYNDIALIKLKEKISFSKHIYPACLYTQPKEPKSLIISGWGKVTQDSENLNNILLEGKNELKLIDTASCNARYQKVRLGGNEKLIPNKINSMMFCASDEVSEELSSDTCPGDSGGPIQTIHSKENGFFIYSVVGITSGGGICGGEPPGLYTRIYYYLEWIEKILAQNEENENFV